MVLDPHVIAFVERAAAANAGRPAIPEAGVEQVRRGYEAMARLGPSPEVHRVTDTVAAGPAGDIPLRVYRPSDGDGLAGLVYIHGGGWTIGSLDSHDPQLRALCARAGIVVVSVGYRLAPEHPYPAAVDDCWAALTHVAADAAGFGIDPTRLAVGGDSAGGNLSAVMALRARDAGIGLALQMLIYPSVDQRMGWPSMEENADAPILPRVSIEWFATQYLGALDAPEVTDPEVSPLLAPSLAGTTRAVVVTAEHDPLRDEGNAYASALMEAGVPVLATEWAGMPHGFLQLAPVVPQGDRLIDLLAAELRLL